MSVNLTAASFDFTSDLPERLPNSLKQAGVDPGRLDFELTEATCVTNIERARIFMEKMNQIGCKVALDDFGSGFGSFYYLKHLPFHQVKIDGDFVKDLPTSPVDQLTVEAMVRIASGLGKTITAEFVQDDATIDLLRTLGVHHAQGYHIGHPRPVAELAHTVGPDR